MYLESSGTLEVVSTTVCTNIVGYDGVDVTAGAER